MLRSVGFARPVLVTPLRASMRGLSTVEATPVFASTPKVNNTPVVTANKSNLPQSPLRMRFLVGMIRGKWIPDALAQLKFSPKHRAEDVAKIVKRAVALAKINHDAIPEELIVSEAISNKGMSHKRLRIMGKGRFGVGYKRWTHVSVKVSVIDFDAKINEAPSMNQKKKWQQRKALVEAIKAKSKSA